MIRESAIIHGIHLPDGCGFFFYFLSIWREYDFFCVSLQNQNGIHGKTS